MTFYRAFFIRCFSGLAVLFWLVVAPAQSQSGFGWAMEANPAWQFDEPVTVLKTVPGRQGQNLAATASGEFWLLQESSGRATSLVTLNLDTSGDLGLSDLAFHPAFPADNRVFVALSEQDRTLGPTTRIAVWRWHRDGATEYRLSDRTTLLTVPADGLWRTQGRLAFDDDGRLLVALGDGGFSPERLNDPENWRGKLLRLNIDVRAPGQPFLPAGVHRAGGARSSVLARGLRSPAGLVAGGPLGVWVLDQGPDGAARLFAAREGAHFGWPCRAGSRQLRRTGGCGSITAATPQWDSGQHESPIMAGNLLVYQVQAFEGDGLPAHTLVFADPASHQVIGYSPFGPREFRASTGDIRVKVLQRNNGQLYGFGTGERRLYGLTE